MRIIFFINRIISQYSKSKISYLSIFFIIQSILEVFTVLIILFLINQILGISNFHIPLIQDLERKSSIYVLSFITILFLLIVFFLNLFVNYRIIDFGYKIYVDIVSKLFNSFIKSNYITINSFSHSEISSKILNESKRFSEFIVIPYFLIVSKIFILLFVLIALLSVKPLMTLLVIVFLILLFLIFYHHTRSKLKKNGALILKYDQEILSNFSNTFYGFKEIKLHNLQQLNSENFLSSQNQMAAVQKKIRFITNSARYFIELIIFIFLMFSILALNYLDSLNQDTYSLIGFYLFVIIKMIPYINIVYLNVSLIRTHKDSINNVKNLNDMLSLSQDFNTDENKKIDNQFGTINNICLKNIDYNHGDQKLFSIKTIKLKNKSITAVTGDSGSGKTTFLDLLSGLIKIKGSTKGLFINDHKITEKNIFFYYNKISYVQQRVFLLEDSIKNNIVLQNRFDEKLFNQVCDILNINEFISQYKNNFNTKISFGRENLSGGQIQRVGIARALYKKPEILILDEATNALEEKLQEKIISRVINFYNIKFIFISTHNNNLIKKCDFVLNINNKNIVLKKNN